MTASSHWFGRRPPEQASLAAAWGARAIFDQTSIDLLPDRQSWSECTLENKTRLLDWLYDKGLPWLRAEVRRLGLATNDTNVLRYDDSGFHLEASPQSSGGYLYIGVWETTPTPYQAAEVGSR